MVSRWVPFENVQTAVRWNGSQASVYAWDNGENSLINRAIANAGLNRSSVKVLPEALVRAPLQSGVRLVAAIDGYEGQVWNDGVILASRWWKNKPKREEWISFVRTANLGPISSELANVEPADIPIDTNSRGLQANYAEDLMLAAAAPQHRLALGALAIALPLFLGMKWVALSATEITFQGRLDEIYASSESVRAQRDEANRNIDQINAILSLDPFPSQFQIMARTFELLRGFNVRIVDWTYDRGALEVSLEGQGQSDLDATRFIEIFERDSLFEKVSARTLPQARTLRMQLNVTPLSGAAT
ncbi:MAG: hypothetical protein KDE14_00600 [Rhodobacteraceae bacterium]|nr:hypothetical protein [Paracoccaceae bacterium]